VQLSHNRKALLKYLLRIIALSSYSPTGNVAATRPQDEDAQLLFASLKVSMLGCFFGFTASSGIFSSWYSIVKQCSVRTLALFGTFHHA